MVDLCETAVYLTIFQKLKFLFAIFVLFIYIKVALLLLDYIFQNKKGLSTLKNMRMIRFFPTIFRFKTQSRLTQNAANWNYFQFSLTVQVKRRQLHSKHLNLISSTG